MSDNGREGNGVNDFEAHQRLDSSAIASIVSIRKSRSRTFFR